jgi:hypothetical protein
VVVLVGLWLAIWCLRLAIGDDFATGDQERPLAYVFDAASNGRWSAQTDFRAEMMSKPPLSTWLGAAAATVAGPSYAALTAPAALSTLTLMLLAWHWARRVWGPAAGLIAGLLMLLPMVGVKMLTYVRTDGVFAATVALTAYAWWWHWVRGGGWWWPWLAAVAATLTKGPLGLVLGSLGLLAVPWQRRTVAASGAETNGSSRLSNWWPLGLLIYLLLAGGWFAWAWSDWGQPLVDRMIVRELIEHAVDSADSSGGIGSQVYKAPLYLLWRTFPWCVFTVLAVVRVFRAPDAVPERSRAERFLASWLLGGTLIFALASHQRGDLIWPVVLPSALLAASEIVRRAQGWPAWTRTWLGPALLAVTLLVVTAYRIADKRPVKSIYGEALAHEIVRGPGAYFPISYGTKYVTQAHLGIQRYLTKREGAVAALSGQPAVYVAVEDADALLREATAAGVHATLVLRSRGGWGVVGNRPDWQASPSTRLLLGPVDVTVEQADWRELRGRRLVLKSLGTGSPVVVIANDGPHVEPFSAAVDGSAGGEPWHVPPHTTLRAEWRGGDWQVALTPFASPGVP